MTMSENTITFTKKDGLCDLNAMQLLMSMLNALRDGDYDIIVKRHHREATSSQYGWLWGVIYPALLSVLNKEGWELTDTAEVHEFFKARLLSRRMVNRNTGETLEFPGSTGDMDTEQMSEFCNRVIDLATEYLGVDISRLMPDPSRKKPKKKKNEQ